MRPPRRYMTKMEQKVLDYLDSHKRPVTQNQLSKYFIVSSSSISNALTELEAAGLVTVTKQGNTKLYRIKADAGNA
jgi:uncharacterized membrane protein